MVRVGLEDYSVFTITEVVNMLGIALLLFSSLLFGLFAKELNRKTLAMLILIAVIIVGGYYFIRRFL